MPSCTDGGPGENPWCTRACPEESVISWAWHKHDEYRDRYAAAARDPANARLTFVRLGSRRDIDSFLADPLRLDKRGTRT
jgi:hypothetical protein